MKLLKALGILAVLGTLSACTSGPRHHEADPGYSHPNHAQNRDIDPGFSRQPAASGADRVDPGYSRQPGQNTIDPGFSRQPAANGKTDPGYSSGGRMLKPGETIHSGDSADSRFSR